MINCNKHCYKYHYRHSLFLFIKNNSGAIGVTGATIFFFLIKKMIIKILKNNQTSVAPMAHVALNFM
jgi:hypothetical protein